MFGNIPLTEEIANSIIADARNRDTFAYQVNRLKEMRYLKLHEEEFREWITTTVNSAIGANYEYFIHLEGTTICVNIDRPLSSKVTCNLCKTEMKVLSYRDGGFSHPLMIYIQKDGQEPGKTETSRAVYCPKCGNIQADMHYFE